MVRAASADDWSAIQAIRTEVFVVGQNCEPEDEWDGFDEESQHILAECDGEPAGTARWRRCSHEGRDVAKLERFAVLDIYRGRGIGRMLVQFAMDESMAAGLETLLLHAQQYLQSFYESFGFRPCGDVFDEVGIPHVSMIREKGGPAALQ